MAIIVSNNDIASSETTYQLGMLWAEASQDERIQAIETVESIWRGLPWGLGCDPFDDNLADVVSTRNQLKGTLFAHARSVIESDGTGENVAPNHIIEVLRGFFRGNDRKVRAPISLLSYVPM